MTIVDLDHVHRVTWADPAEIPDDRERFHVLDPWGNRLELLAGERTAAAD
jgi:hypothetical protein